MGNALEVKEVSKKYGIMPKKTVLKNVSFHIEKGECLCILGANGEGKSTLIKIVAGLVSKDHGNVHIDGKLGYMPETSINFPSLNAYEAMNYYDLLSGNKKNYLKYMESFSIVERKKRIKKYSKGMKRKLDLIRALNLEPDLLLLDEPFEGLDPGVCNDMISVIAKEKSRGSAVLMSTHDISYVEKIADRVFLLKNGVLKEIREWKRETTILTVQGSIEKIPVLFKDFPCEIIQDGQNVQIKVVGSDHAISAIQLLSGSGITIKTQEVISLENIFLREVEKRNL